MREQEIGFTALLVMTVWNSLLGLMMVFEIVPVKWGMLVSFVGMFCVNFVAYKMLMGNERPWESRSQYRERINNK